MTPDEREAVHDHLYLHPPVQGIQRKSSFMGALTDARGIGNRDLLTGKLREGAKDSGGWMPAIGYLVLLDQIGSCFGAPGCTHPAGGASFIHALECFSGLPHLEVETLYALRCALAHDYSLFNVNTPDRTHVFTYDDSEHGPLVQLRQTPWTGDHTAIAADQITTVNLRAVGDLVEGIVEKLRALLASNDLVLRLPVDEFRKRYFMQYQVP
jgi:hypothetical protein